MVNFMLFFSKFISYLLLMLVIVIVAAVGFVVGRILRKNKNAKAISADTSSTVE